MLKCECGREFENSQAFNGHKSSCETHLIAKYGDLTLYYERKKVRAKKASETKSEVAAVRREARLQQWISEQHTCKHCGKIMTEIYGSGNFCCRACANSRDRSDETKAKIRKSVSGTNAYFNPDTLEIRYFRSDNVPDGWCKGTVKKAENKESFKILSSTPKRPKDQNKANEIAELRAKIKEFRENFLVQQKKANADVLSEYIEMLHNKINGREFMLPEKIKLADKYLWAENKNHPRAIKYGTKWVHVHVLAAEELLGRYLTDEEVVHHINENKLDNRFENFIIFDTLSSHARFHNTDECVLRIDNDRLVCDKLIYPEFNYITD